MSLPLEIALTIFRYLGIRELLRVQLTCRLYYAKAREILLGKDKKIFFSILSTINYTIVWRLEKDDQATTWMEFKCQQCVVTVPMKSILDGWKLRILGSTLIPLNIKNCILYKLPITNKSATPAVASTFQIVYSPDIVLAYGRVTLIYYGYTSLSADEVVHFIEL